MSQYYPARKLINVADYKQVHLRLDLMDFAGCLVLPVTPVLQRPVKRDSPGTGTIIDTAAAVPAFIRMQDNWRFAFLGVGYVNIYLADFYTMVAPVAYLRIESHRLVRCSNIRHGH